jgi:hypothetical protein
MSNLCEYCNHLYTTKNHLTRHQNTDKCRYIKSLLDKRDQINIEKNNNIQKENELLKKENKKLKLENDKFNEENNKKDHEIKLLNDKCDEYRKIVEKAAVKSTTTVKKTYNHNNYLNYISSEPLKISEFPKQLKHIVNCDTVMYDDDDFHDHIVDNILKDKDGKDKVLCTDINRKNFTYKDEKSGELISDPELERLREQLKKGTDIRQIRHELLEKLVSEYEENGCIGIDPYKRFSEIIQKLNFGNPFIDHVAKKTYVKTKNVTDEKDTIEFKNKKLKYTESENNSLEEEYQQLLEEFGNE